MTPIMIKARLTRLDPLASKTPDKDLIRLTLRLPLGVKKTIEELSTKKGVSLNSIMIHLLIKGIQS